MIREKIALTIDKAICEIMPEQPDRIKLEQFTQAEQEFLLEFADQILSLITTEIEKVGNPYMPIRSGTSDADRNSTFESCRNKILNLLKEQI